MTIQTQTKRTLSVALIAFNEADNIARTLESIKDLADEIIVVDSNSTDNTCEIARQFGAKVIVQPWLGFVQQKQFLFEQCSQDFILNLDCDEVVPAKLHAEITQILQAPQFDGYKINRKSVYLGKVMNYAWQPDSVLRLVKRSAVPTWHGKYVHESLHIKGNVTNAKYFMLHYSYKSVADHILRSVKYAELSAKESTERGKKSSLFKVFSHALSAFWRTMVARRSYKDGYRGILVVMVTTLYVAMKYIFLYANQHKADGHDHPAD
jgi:glycosyltransferase involved in cell wall biosynthesis